MKKRTADVDIIEGSSKDGEGPVETTGLQHVESVKSAVKAKTSDKINRRKVPMNAKGVGKAKKVTKAKGASKTAKAKGTTSRAVKGKGVLNPKKATVKRSGTSAKQPPKKSGGQSRSSSRSRSGRGTTGKT